VQRELETGDDAEIAAAAADRPEQVRVPGAARCAPHAVGRDDLGADQVVDRQPVHAAEPAEAAAQGQAADAGGRVDAERNRQSEGLGLVVDVGAAARRHRPRPGAPRVDMHAAHAGQVDDQAVVAQALPAMLWPPPRTATGRRCSFAKASAASTSAVPLQRAISAGRRSIIAFHTILAAS
jgi:hypothetical protein